MIGQASIQMTPTRNVMVVLRKDSGDAASSSGQAVIQFGAVGDDFTVHAPRVFMGRDGGFNTELDADAKLLLAKDITLDALGDIDVFVGELVILKKQVDILKHVLGLV